MSLNFRQLLNKGGYAVLFALGLLSCEELLIEEDISNLIITTIAPKDDITLTDSIVNFSWNPIEDANRYQLQIATPSFENAAQVVVDTTFTSNDSISNSYHKSFILAPNSYEWRVQALNGSSNTQYSTEKFNVEYQLFTEDLSDKTVVIIAPSEDVTLDIKEISFTWEALEFAENYQLQIATPDFENPTQVVVDELVTATSSVQTLENGTYQWRIKAKNSTSETPYTTINFAVDALTFNQDISDKTVAIIAPMDGVVLETNELNFTWESVEFAEDYKIQIATPNFNNPIQVVVDDILASTTSTQTLENGTYQWRIKARNSESQTAYTVASFSIQSNTNDLSNETVPIIAPTNGAVLITNENNFTWASITNADDYVLQIATPDFNNPIQIVVDEILTSTSATHILDNGTYQWRVKARNASSETVYTTASFTVQSQNNDISNEVVSLIAPTDGTILEINELNFTWESITNADDYVLQIATPNFNNPIQVVVDEILTSTSATHTLDNGNYQWRVKARNATSQTIYTTASFVVDAPIAFSDRDVFIISPANNFVSNQSILNIQWQPVVDATLYRIQILDAATNAILSDQTTTQTVIPFTFPEGNLIWQVRAETSSESTQYTSQNITIDSVAPNIPTLLTPLDTEILTTTNVTFTWSRTAIAGTLEKDILYVYLDSGLTNLVLQEEVTNSTYTTTLTNNETYYWLMKATDEAGNESGNSTVFSFTINE